MDQNGTDARPAGVESIEPSFVDTGVVFRIPEKSFSVFEDLQNAFSRELVRLLRSACEKAIRGEPGDSLTESEKFACCVRAGLQITFAGVLGGGDVRAMTVKDASVFMCDGEIHVCTHAGGDEYDHVVIKLTGGTK